MTTPWAFPSTISQYTEPGTENIYVSWNDNDQFKQLKNLDNRSLQSNGALFHIARSPKHDIENKTYFIKATNFNFQNVPNVISGVELRLNAQRYGRAVDDTIQLTLSNNVIGNNKADLMVKPEKIYGGQEDLWGVSTLSKSNVENSSFGVVIRFKSHPKWPHKDPVFIDSVEMRIY